MTTNHTALKEVGRKILESMGYQSNEIKEEYEICGNKKSFRVDLVGLKESKSIAVECGTTSGEKIAALKMFFDQVIVLPYFTLNLLKEDYERIIRQQNDKIQNLTKECERLQSELSDRQFGYSSIERITKDCFELCARIIGEYGFYGRFEQNSDIEIIQGIRNNLISLENQLREIQNKRLQERMSSCPGIDEKERLSNH